MRQYNVGSPFERIAIDIAGPFPVSDHGNKYILVAMDYFSKWAEAYALPNQEAITVADVLVKEWICRFGIPNGAALGSRQNFESNLFQEICLLLNIRKTRTTALHPQSDGMVERMNRTINRHLSKVVSDHQRDWDQYLHLFLMAYRSAVHESTGQTPASIIMGRELRLPCDLKFGIPPGTRHCGEDYVSKLRQRMGDMHERVRLNIQSASDKMKKTYDIKADAGGFKGIAVVFSKKFGQLQTLREQNPEVGGVLQLKKGQRNIYYLVTKRHSQDKPSYEDVWKSLTKLRDTMVDQNLVDLAIPKLSCGIDGLDWRVIRSMLEAIFRSSGVKILVCCNPLPRPIMKTVECYSIELHGADMGSHADIVTLQG
ncbi:hypothetical protein JTB14_023666 [Gonioctena quinquepunctata]|nr:hypothetical protein JTB14_023666 [Gonioctena quinquepunctata]